MKNDSSLVYVSESFRERLEWDDLFDRLEWDDLFDRCESGATCSSLSF